MIIVKLSGGMGNQMFQYAFGLKWAKYHSTTLHLDLSWFQQRSSSFILRPYVLDCFQTDISIVSFNDLSRIGVPIIMRNNIFAKVWNKLIYKVQARYIKQKNVVDLYEDDTIPDNSYLEGTWISKKHCSEVSIIIKNQYKVKEAYLLNHPIQSNIRKSNSVAVHIRRGDYLTTGNFLLNIEYFFKGIEEIQMSVVHNLHFFIFSDDIQWCKMQLMEYIETNCLKVSFIDEMIPSGEYDTYHFHLMKSCKHFIISNSTFSWWAAWLSEYENKVVVCPLQFEQQNVQHKHLIFSNWKIVDNRI